MPRAAGSRHIKAQPESITKQTGAARFSDLLEEPSPLVLLLLLLIFHYCLFLSLSPPLLLCYSVRAARTHFSVCVAVIVIPCA